MKKLHSLYFYVQNGFGPMKEEFDQMAKSIEQAKKP